MGGTERVIFNLTKYLGSNGIKSFIGFFEGVSGNIPHISGSVDLTNYTIAHYYLGDFIKKENISIIISFKKYFSRKILKVIESSGCGYIASLRFRPVDHLEKVKLLSLKDYDKSSIKYILKCIFKSLYFEYVKIITRSRIKRIFKVADRYVLLSDKYRDSFCRINGIKNQNEKIVSISNALSFNESISSAEIFKKEKKVLIVSRMMEKSKRIFLALDIWNEFIKDTRYNDWGLIIVGDGIDLPRYKKYVKEIGIANVSFEGRRDPYSYYKSSSIFLMTSSGEGFPMTLIEAQQLGCIPIAFNNYESLNDIIEHGYNGFIIDNNNKMEFIQNLKNLAENNDMRIEFAQNAIKSCEKFSIDIIGERWLNLINDVWHERN